MKAARIHYLAASNPYLASSTSMLYIAAPWGATVVQLYFLLRLNIVHVRALSEASVHKHGAAALM